MSRRSVLAASGIAAGAAVLSALGLGLELSQAEAAELPRWSDPDTWGTAGVPGPTTSVLLEQAVLLDVDAVVRSLRIAPGAALHFDPSSSRTFTSSGNVVVEGLLQMRPAGAAVQHLMRFSGVDETRFVGGGMQVLESDVGLWCTGQGVLDLAGAPRTAWARTVSSVPVGAQTLTLQADPVGWQVGDELAIVPTGSPANDGHALAYDYATVTGLAGRQITLSRATTYEHPALEVGPGMLLAPEVLNLTRNVAVEGTPGHRTHVTIFAARPQHLSYFGLRHVGPRQSDGEGFTKGVLGRYGVHFHMVGDASRGSTLTGGVVRDAGSHSYVAHASHGITLTSCVAHDVFDDAFWWDGMVDTRTAAADTHDIAYRGCIASLVKSDPPFRGDRLTGFTLGAGRGSTAADCVAIGVQGNGDASGFHWPEGPTSGVWGFERNVAHNNAWHGSFVWQNTTAAHVVQDFVAYHNGGAGVSHGAYVNSYLYENCFLYANRASAVDLHSNSGGAGDRPQVFRALHCDARGLSEHALRLVKHDLQPGQPSLLLGCTFLGQRSAAVAAVYDLSNGPTTPELLDVVECSSSTALLLLRDDTYSASRVRVQQGGEAVVATPRGTAGTWRPEWNAVVNPADRFSAEAAVPAAAFPVLAAAPVLDPVSSAPSSSTSPSSAVPSASSDPHVHPEPSTATSSSPSPSPFSSPSSTRTAKPGKPPRKAATAAPLMFTASLRTTASGHHLTLTNTDPRACLVEMMLDGRVVKRVSLKKGTTKVRIPRKRGARTLTARCHSHSYAWALR